MEDVLDVQKLKPDFEYQGASDAAHLAYVHRLAEPDDIYFVSNQRGQFDSVDCTFRVSGKQPELWHPDTGRMEPAPVWNARDGRTTVRLSFDPAGSVFVVFRRPADATDHLAAVEEAPAAPGDTHLVIRHAEYKAIDGAGSMDVTATLNQLAQKGRLDLTVGNDTMGRDPAGKHVKQLIVDYTLDGQPGRAVVDERKRLTLSVNDGTGSAWEIGSARDGTPVLRAWGDVQTIWRTAKGKTRRTVATGVPKPLKVVGPWSLRFPPNWGAPPSIVLDRLISWPKSDIDGVRYFSGTATYEKEIDIPADRLGAGRELWLDLGKVKNFAEVSLNGRAFGVLWKPPFRVNVTDAAQPGRNKLVVKVTNLWPNRLIGDEQLPPDCEWDGKKLKAWPEWLLEGKPSPTGRYTFTTWHHYTKNSPLQESGLLGPVALQTAEVVPVK